MQGEPGGVVGHGEREGMDLEPRRLTRVLLQTLSTQVQAVSQGQNRKTEPLVGDLMDKYSDSYRAKITRCGSLFFFFFLPGKSTLCHRQAKAKCSQ